MYRPPGICGDGIWCGGRTPKEFGRAGLTQLEVVEVLHFNQTGITMLILSNLVLFSLWLLATLVPGFCLYDGNTSEVNAVTHVGWWAVIEMFALVIGMASIYFRLNYNRKGRIEKGVADVRNYLVLYIVVLVFAIVSNVLHAVLSIFEVVNCSSTLCTDSYGFLIVLIVILFVLALFEAWLIYRSVVYRNNLFWALVSEKGSFNVNSEMNDAVAEVKMTDTMPFVQQPIIANNTTTTHRLDHALVPLSKKG